ncbi:putative short chain dehydrogenase [Xylogone sp. PMI_703]|nr:putative short chain dehydrogenase [Xylogone sp. PMI_703]
MPFSLRGKKVLITGGSRGLGAVIVDRFAQEGCDIILTYIQVKTSANEVARNIAEKYGVITGVLQADQGSQADCSRIISETHKILNGLDIVIANAGWTKFSTFSDMNALSDSEWDKCWAVNVKGLLYLARDVIPIFNKNPDGGVLINTSSIAAINPGGSSMAYAATRAAGAHLSKCIAATQGPKVRVNSILLGVMLTEWGKKFGDTQIKNVEQLAVLKRTTRLEDVADMFVSVAKNTSLTGQNILIGMLLDLYMSLFKESNHL